VIATLQSLDPIFVDFLLPQQAVAQLTVGAKVEAKVDAFPDRMFTGKITAINPKIETASRNIQVRATLPNADQKLLPGMFATVQLETGAAQRLITLPQTAVSYNPYGSLVYLVDDKGKDADGKPQLTARQVFVTTGATRGDQVAILKGVAEGDMVVTSGQIKLRNGVPVVVDNRVVPKNDPAPKIVDN
jgi:membrane fusion protein (multidrug efflux system)